MSDKDFVVKNGIVVNTAFAANSTAIYFGNSTVNTVITEANVTISNSAVVGILTGSSFTGTSANSTKLNNQIASYYTDATNMSTGTLPDARLSTAVVNTVGNFTVAGNINFTSTNTVFGSGIVVGSRSANAVIANNTVITIGNATINATINSTTFSGAANNTTYLNGQLASYYTSATNINTGTLPYARIPANIVNTTSAFVLAANLSVNAAFSVKNYLSSPYANVLVVNTSVIEAGGMRANVATITTIGAANVGTINTLNEVNVGGNLTVIGNLTVLGDSVTMSTATLDVEDLNITLAKGVVSNAAADGAGITIDGKAATWKYNHTSNSWQSNLAITPSTNNLLLGNATSLWQVSANQISGTLTTESQPNITANNASYLGGVAASGYIQSGGGASSVTIGANAYFPATNNFYLVGFRVGDNVAATTSSIWVANSLINNSITATGLTIGNSTTTASGSVSVQNVSGTSTLTATSLTVGTNTATIGTAVYSVASGRVGLANNAPAGRFQSDLAIDPTLLANNTILYQPLASYGTTAAWDRYRFISTVSANTGDASATWRQFHVGMSGVGIGAPPPAATTRKGDALYVYGNVGINTVAPARSLDIGGDIAVSGNIYIGGTTSAININGSQGTINQILVSDGSKTAWSSTINPTTMNANLISANNISVENQPTYIIPTNISAGSDKISLAINGSYGPYYGDLPIVAGDLVKYWTDTGTVIGGLTNNANYFVGGIVPGVVDTSATSFQLFATKAHAIAGTPVVDITTTGGTQTGSLKHYFEADYSQFATIKTIGGGVALTIGNTTVNAYTNSSSFSGLANNIYTYPLNQSVNTIATPTFGATTFTAPITVYTTGSASQGVIYLGQGTTRSLSYNGTKYVMPGAGLLLNGQNVLTDDVSYAPLTGGTFTGLVTVEGRQDSPILVGGSAFGGLRLQGVGGGGVACTTSGAFMSFHRPSSYGTYFGLDTDNQIAVGGWSAGAALGPMKVGALGVGTTASSTAGSIRATNDITAFFSDKRLKKDIAPITNALESVSKLNGIKYRHNEVAQSFGFEDTKTLRVGVIAQEVFDVLPEAIRPAPFDEGENGISKSGQGYLTVQYEKLVPLLIEAIKELKAEVDELKKSK